MRNQRDDPAIEKVFRARRETIVSSKFVGRIIPKVKDVVLLTAENLLNSLSDRNTKFVCDDSANDDSRPHDRDDVNGRLHVLDIDIDNPALSHAFCHRKLERKIEFRKEVA